MSDQPDPRANPLQDFLERYVSDGFKRELDLEEAVWRTLPAFVTALGLLGAAATFVLRQTATGWSIEDDWLASIGLVATLAAMTKAAWELRYSVKRRSHRYPPDEVEMCRWATELRSEALGAGADPARADQIALEKLRAKVLREVAEAASCNQVVNAAKMTGRTKAARWIFWAAVLMFLTVVTQVLSEARHLENVDEQRARGPTATTAAASPAASGASSEVGREGQHHAAQVSVNGSGTSQRAASPHSPALEEPKIGE